MADAGNGGKADLIELLLEDHKAAEALVGQVGQPGVDGSKLFDELVGDLVPDEVAEEEVVYPAVRSSVEGGKALADARVRDQHEVEELLKSMGKMDRSRGVPVLAPETPFP